MFRKLYNETPRHMIQFQKNQGNGNNGHNKGIGQWRNRKGTRQDKSRRFTRIYSTIYTSIQQKEIQKATRKAQMGSQNKSDGQSPKGIKCKGICNDAQRRGSPKLVARQTTQGRTHCRIKVKICSTMFLYPKEGRFITVGSRL